MCPSSRWTTCARTSRRLGVPTPWMASRPGDLKTGQPRGDPLRQPGPGPGLCPPARPSAPAPDLVLQDGRVARRRDPGLRPDRVEAGLAHGPGAGDPRSRRRVHRLGLPRRRRRRRSRGQAQVACSRGWPTPAITSSATTSSPWSRSRRCGMSPEEIRMPYVIDWPSLLDLKEPLPRGASPVGWLRGPTGPGAPTDSGAGSRRRRRATCTSVRRTPRCATGCSRRPTARPSCLRIEDTDAERNRPELTDNILDMLRWLGLDWDGEPIHQSDRFDEYRGCCRPTDRRRGRVLVRLHPGRTCRPGTRNAAASRGMTASAATEGSNRARVAPCASGCPTKASPDGTTSSADKVTFENGDIEDFVVVRSNGNPTFFLANVVDDEAMGITHVIRGEDHVNGTPKYLLLRAALGLRRAARRSRICHFWSTRSARSCPSGATTCRWRPTRTVGFLPEAHAQLSVVARLGTARWCRSASHRRDHRPVPPRGRQSVAGVLRSEEARARQRRMDPEARPGRLHRTSARVRPRRWATGRAPRARTTRTRAGQGAGPSCPSTSTGSTARPTIPARGTRR